MAVFNPTPNPTNDPSYLNWSKEPEKRKANTAVGDLFSGVAAIGDAAIGAADRAIKEDFIKPDAIALVEPELERAGGNITPEEAKMLSQYESGRPMPAGAQASIEKLGRLKAAYEAGELSEEYFNARLLPGIKQMRSRYAGHREAIDEAVSRVLNEKTANTLRKETLQAFEKGAARIDAEGKRHDAWYEKNAQYLHMITPNATKDHFIANRTKYEVEVGQRKARDQEFESEGKRFDYEAKDNTAKGREASRLLLRQGNAIVSDLVSGTTNAVNMKYPELQQRLHAEQAKGVKADPKALAELTLSFQQMENHALAQFRARLNAPRVDEATGKVMPSFGSYLSAEETKALEARVMAPMQTYKELVGYEKFGLANMAGNVIQHQGKLDTLRIFEELPIARVISALKDVADPVTVNMLYRNGQLLPKFEQAVVAAQLSNLFDTRPDAPPPAPASKLISGMNENRDGNVPPEKVLPILNNAIGAMKSSDPKVVVRAVQQFQGDPKLWNELSESDQRILFRRAGTKEVTDAILATGDNAAWSTHSAWMERTFARTFRGDLATLQQGITFDRLKIEFDAKEMKFNVQNLTPDANPVFWAVRVGESTPEGYVRGVNEALASLRPVLETNYPDDGGRIQRLTALLGASGVDMNAPKGGTWLEEATKSIFKGIQKQTDENFAKSGLKTKKDRLKDEDAGNP